MREVGDCQVSSVHMANVQNVDSTVAAWSRLLSLTSGPLLELEVAQRLLWSGRLLEDLLDAASSDVGLSKRGDYEVLALLYRSQPDLLSPIDVATHLRLSASGVTGKLDRLQREGLLERLQHPRDRRALRLRITERGQSLVEANLEQGLRIYHNLLKVFSIQDLETLRRLLRTIHEQLSAASANGPAPLPSPT